jgi:23S rRNA (uracil1939-C5)-methyltransferase
MKLQIEKLVYGGAGMAHADGAGDTLLLPYTLPGETVAVATEAGETELLRVLEAAPERVAARCPHFGQCGGCQLQHAEYSAQVSYKVGILREALEQSGVSEVPEVQAHVAEPWGYRNRIRLRIATVDGVLRLGYSRRGGVEFLPVRECPISAPLLWRAAAALLQLGAGETPAQQWLRAAVEVEFFANAVETRLQMNLFVRKAPAAGFGVLCKQLQAAVPELSGAGVSVLPKESAERSRRMERSKAGASWGAAGLLYRAASMDYWVSRGGFFQVNRFLVEEMVQIVCAGRSGRLAWDLYAGVGLFSRVLAQSFEHVVAVEGGETAAADLSQGMKGTGMRAVCASTLQFLQAAVIQRERPELIVMDPPRAGVGAEVCALLARVKVPELVYVSCDPVTMARDLKSLVDSGYRLAELHLVDMFPQTFHIETIAILRR